MTDAFDRLAKRVRERAEQREERAAAARAERESWLARLEDEQHNVGKRFSQEQEADRASREAAWQAELESRRPEVSGPGCRSCGSGVTINGHCRCS
jgi:hypothetical protein